MGESDALLGKWAFGPQRKSPEEANREPNTLYEDDLQRALEDFFRNNRPLDPDQVRFLIRCHDSGRYGDVLRPPFRREVYRGMSVETDGPDWAEKYRDLAQSGAEFVFQPRHGLSSWSENESGAENFASTQSGRAKGVILVAAVQDQPEGFFLAGRGGLYGVRGFDVYDEEAEAVGVGPIRCRVLRVREGAGYGGD